MPYPQQYARARAAARAIKALETVGWNAPSDSDPERETWTAVRRGLFEILDVNGCELTAPGSARVRAKRTTKP